MIILKIKWIEIQNYWVGKCSVKVMLKFHWVSSRRHCHISRVCVLSDTRTRADFPLKFQISQPVLCPFCCTGLRLPWMSPWWKTQPCRNCCPAPPPPTPWVLGRSMITLLGLKTPQYLPAYSKRKLTVKLCQLPPISAGPRESHPASNCSAEGPHRDSQG